MAFADSNVNGLNVSFVGPDVNNAPSSNLIVNGPVPTVEEEWKPREENNENDAEHADDGDNPVISNIQVGEEAPKKKKKKKRKSKGSRKFPPPTGFEDNFVDGPLTPDITTTESEIYHPSKHFTERIETCIQRYRARRKFDPIRLQIFSTYLNLGGISTGPKAFSGGLDIKNNDDLDAEQIQKMTATEFVPAGMKNDDDGDWDVDFEYVARGFLSHKVPYVLGYMKFEDLELSAKVVRNFLNYVMYHSVAPEHTASILAARDICDLAEKELILCRQVSSRLPGKFNMACSTLFGGYYKGMQDETMTWDAGLASDVGLTNSQAEAIFNASLEKRGTAFQKEMGKRARLVKGEFLAVEVTGIVFAGTSGVKRPLPKEIEDEIEALKEEERRLGDSKNPEAPKNPEALKKHSVGAGGEEQELPKYNDTGLNALGRLLVKVWVPEGPEQQEPPETNLDEFEIWLEMEALQYCFVGMHIEAKVHTMSSGIIWIDSVTAVQCSFYLHLDSPEKESDDEFD